MQSDTLKATVQYQHYEGTLAGDGHDGRSLEQLAKLHDIDTNKYFIIGVKVSIGETDDELQGNLGPVFVEFLAVDKQAIGAGSIDGIRKYSKENGHLPYSRLEVKMIDTADLLRYFKRLEFVLLNSVLSGQTFVNG